MLIFSPFPTGGGTVPLADLAGQPVAVGGVETLPAGGDAAPLGRGSLGGAGGALFLAWPCG